MLEPVPSTPLNNFILIVVLFILLIIVGSAYC
ncbi:YjcZ family sporulation protein [Bacillus solitudinis]|nr:YjcZ family sporulation protein [Bacillus solitudinis]